MNREYWIAPVNSENVFTRLFFVSRMQYSQHVPLSGTNKMLALSVMWELEQFSPKLWIHQQGISFTHSADTICHFLKKKVSTSPIECHGQYSSCRALTEAKQCWACEPLANADRSVSTLVRVFVPIMVSLAWLSVLQNKHFSLSLLLNRCANANPLDCKLSTARINFFFSVVKS